MEYSVNTTPLLQECDSDNDIDEDIGTADINKDYKAIFKPIEPKDKYYLAFLIFYLLGMVTLLPWNFFVTADDYWIYKFRNTSDPSGNLTLAPKRTPLQASFTSYISIASALPNLVFLIINSALVHRISLHKRVIGSLFSILFLFVLTLIFVEVNTDKWQNNFFILTMITIVLLNVSSAILSGSVFGIIGRFHPIYITATTAGQALGGIFAAIAEIVSLAIGASSRHSAFVYFTIGIITIIVSIICYIILINSQYFKFHLTDKITEDLDLDIKYDRNIIFKKMWTYGISLFTVFAITLSVYPGVTVLIESEGRGRGHKWNDVYFVPTIAYLLFSVGDYLGRIIAGRLQKPKNGYIQIILSISRFVFIPLLLLCNAQPRHSWAVIFDKDYQYIIILSLCAFTNGYLANLTTICAPKVVENHEKEIASTIMTVFLGIGLGVGSVVSFLIVKIL